MLLEGYGTELYMLFIVELFESSILEELFWLLILLELSLPFTFFILISILPLHEFSLIK